MADAFFERITLFPMEGDPIPNEDCLSNIDKNQFPSLEPFGVICGFFGEVKLQLDDEGGADLARLSFEMKKSCEYTIPGDSIRPVDPIGSASDFIGIRHLP